MQIKNYTNHKLLMESGRWNNIDRVNIIFTKSDDITTGAWGMDFVSSSPLFSPTPPFFKIFI